MWSNVYIYNGSFRAARLPRPATCTAEPLCHSWVAVVSNKHNWPEFYLGNAWACPGLKPPMYIYTMNNLARCYSLLSQCGINWIYYLYLVLYFLYRLYVYPILKACLFTMYWGQAPANRMSFSLLGSVKWCIFRGHGSNQGYMQLYWSELEGLHV